MMQGRTLQGGTHFGSSAASGPLLVSTGTNRGALGLAACLAALALAGCGIPRDTPPAMASAQAIPAQWVLAEPGGTDIALDRYWVMLNDPLVDTDPSRTQL